MPVKPREQTIVSTDGRAAWVMVIYEAKDGNVFDDDILSQIAKFEKELLTNANGATRKGEVSPWHEEWCQKVYPSSGDGSGKCMAVSSVVPLFSMTEGGMAAVADQVEKGYGTWPLAKCLCSTEDKLCSVCTEAGDLKPIDEWPVCARSLRRLANSADNSDVNKNCSDNHKRPAPSPAEIKLALQMFCSTRPRCQWAPSFASTCSSSVFYHPTDQDGLVSGEPKEQAIARMCDENNTGWWRLRKSILPQSLDCRAATKKAKYARTIFFPGAEDPNNADTYEEFERGYVTSGGTWFRSVSMLETKTERESKGKLRILLYSAVTLFSQFMSVLIFDACLSIGSMVFVWSYMWYTLESFFLASCAMFEIIFSLPVTFFLWNVIFQQKIIFTQILVIFVILGIGADDAFILYDAWLQSRFAGDEVTKHWTTRFAFAYRRAFHAMGVTTATTCGSFVIGACSPLPQVRSFCVFAAVVVCVDWIFCITFFASAIIVNERMFVSTKRKAGECLGPGCCWGLWRCIGASCCRRCCSDAPIADDELQKKRGMERFCEGPLFDCLNFSKILLVFTWFVVVALMAVSGLVQLRTAEKPAPIGRQDIDVTRGFEILLEEWSFRGVPSVHFVYGIDPDEAIDEWGTDSSPNVPRYTSVDRLKTQDGQLELFNLCRAADGGRIDDVRCDSRACIISGRGTGGRCSRREDVWRETGVYVPQDEGCLNGRYCFIEDFAEFWAFNAGDCVGVTAEAACTAKSGCAWSTGTRGKYVCFSTTNSNDYPGLSESTFVEELFGAKFAAYRQTRDAVLQSLGQTYAIEEGNLNTGFRQGSSSGIQLAWVSFNATIPIVNTVEEANTWYKRWEDFRKEHTPTLGGFQTTEVYLFMVTQNEMVKAAVMGILLSLIISYVVMLLTTQNWWIAALGLLNIGCISVVFLGTMPLLGWSLGENECIFLIAVVGLSVDYTVHLLHSYNLSSGSRLQRCRTALGDMGISVVNSSITTLLACAILFGCGFYFFFQFGAFIFFVIGYSILMSITLLIPLLMLFGPGDSQGDITKFFKKSTEADPLVKARGSCASKSSVLDTE
eukprot:TRINITY_DN11218_c0_g1_i1.p1 TRINITY_DN11218_c0_g1~~TRINITY_DN11218_c0_g1_i1.p1  ORF type:complete len:1167 (-),score=160.03 TRINITY_DN11218_c0_g1_i1:20-3229(-)